MKLELGMAGNKAMLEALDQLKEILVKSGLEYRMERIEKEENTEKYATTVRIAFNLPKTEILTFLEENKRYIWKVRLYKEITQVFSQRIHKIRTNNKEKAENLLKAVEMSKRQAKGKEKEVLAFSGKKDSIWKTKREYSQLNHTFRENNNIGSLKDYLDLKKRMD